VNFFFRFGQILLNLARIFAVHRGNSFFFCVFKVSIDHVFILFICLFIYLFPFFINVAATPNAEWRWYLVIRVRKLGESGSI